MKIKELRKELYKIFKIVKIKDENKKIRTLLADQIKANDELATERDFYKVNYENANLKLIELKREIKEIKEKKESNDGK
jgi:predicted ATPase